MRSSQQGRVGYGLAVTAATVLFGCRPAAPPEEHFYDVHIQPILNASCVGNTSPCHSIATDPVTNKPTALGNLDLSSFDGVQKRRDVLRTYGSYPQPLLLLKAMPPESNQIPYQGNFYPSEIQHSGGTPIQPNSEAYFELKNWLDNGANRDGIAPQAVANKGTGQCSDALPPASQRIAVDTTSQAYQDFKTNIEPMLESSCAYGSCHSSVQADLYLTCGLGGDDPDAETAFNYAQVAGFVIAPPADKTMVNVDQSEILLRPLAIAAGGVSHTGGTFFASRTDSTWLSWESWATEVQAAPPLVYGPKTAGQTFFETNVMPKLLVRGCDLEGCHSPDGFNDFRLRSGAFGFFAPAALTRNYHALADEFMAFDTVDVKQSRAVKKNIIASSGGTTHRAGPILEDINTSVDTPCPQPFVAGPTTRAFCVLQAWQQTERQDRIAAGSVSPMTAGSTLPLVFVARPTNGDDLLHFDTYEGGADLKLADATVDANGQVTTVGNVRSALGPCAGLAGQDVDVRGPEWSYDATKVVFAARPGAASGLDLWLLDVAGATCTRLTNDAGRMVSGVRVHNFDPVFAPDNTIVFASTRAGTLTQRNMLPNSDLFRVKPLTTGTFSYDFSSPEQMTFLLNSELAPAFMQDGRVSFTAEKATPDFYQLSGRRINWDLTDYHPLLAQRAQSTSTFDNNLLPSVGYQEATEIREGLDRNFVLILSNEGAKGGGGALATFNRSIGPFEADRTDVTFVKSMVIVDPAAAPAADGTTVGAYRSPFSLPNGEILASYAANVANINTDVPLYALVAVNQQTGARRPLASDGAFSYVEAALGYKRGETELFSNLPQLVFGGHAGGGTGSNGVMHFPDVPVLATLLGANLRRGRDVSAFDSAASLKVYQDMPPPANSTKADIPMGAMAYSQLKTIGAANLLGDHSLKVLVPAGVPLILEVDDGSGKALFTMSEEHQVIASEYITPGPQRAVFNNICAGCHGSLSGSELDVAVSADALTGASISQSRYADPQPLQ